jgi:multicomponent Na+:H+ antiporter subunit D
MLEHTPSLVVVLPLMAAFLVTIAGWLGSRWPFGITVAALAASLGSAVVILARVLAGGPFSYRLGNWPPPIGIEYYLDHLNALVLVLVAAVGLATIASCRRKITQTYGAKAPVFYTLALFSVAGHLGVVATGDAFNLYVLLEITALSGYALLAMGSPRAPMSTLRYLYMGTVGASFYLLGVGYLYIMTGSLNMLDLARILPGLAGSTAIAAAFFLILCGVLVKMAFFPLHSWLPGAYSDAGGPASALIAPLTTKVMIYVMLRMMFTVFGTDYVFSQAFLAEVMVWAAVAAIVAGALFALAQRDLKRMLSYILVSEVGYMVGGAWLGNRLAMTGTILHIVNDALMTFCVFLAAAAIASRTQSLRFEHLKGLFARMPFTMGAFAIGALSMIGVPPTCGFFSKWYLILGGIEAGHWGFVAALVFSSLINVVLFFRIFEIGLFESEGHGRGQGHEAPQRREASWNMLVPLLATAAGLVAVGLLTGTIVSRVIQHAIPAAIA